MRKFFFENLGLKIAAVLLSIVLWVFVTWRGQSEISVDVPLEFKNLPAGLEIVNHTAKTVSLSIKGQERFVKNVRPSDIRVSIDLSKAKRGESIYYITRDEIKLPHALAVTNIMPSSIKVTTEETISKTVRVIPLITGEPEKGYYVKSIEVNPPTVTIEGVKSEIARIKNVKTEVMDITGLNETFAQDLKLDLTGRNARAATSSVTVKVVIAGKGK
jgi:YbbR domain-containing protein